jgi:FixJ family two-component response regulator
MMNAGDRLSTTTIISIIDDDDDVRTSLTDLMEAIGFTVAAFSSAMDFLASPNLRQTSCLIADVNMPALTGIELHHYLMGEGYAIPTILITAYPDEDVRAQVLGQGVIGYLSKPLDEHALLGCVDSALQLTGPDHAPS